MNVKYHKKIGGLIAILLFLNPLVASAIIKTVAVKITVLAPPPCVINDNSPIVVDFGYVKTNEVDGHHYRMPIDFQLVCNGGIKNMMKLQINGYSTEFDNTLLRTNKSGLGIKFQQGMGNLPINSWLNFTYPNKPELWAILAKQDDVSLTSGAFSASATMHVLYQ
ncbi:fimbrial protein [Serratia sp. NPDC078593]|uniref:fimbrial protein n=1 Tax=unclassified Serratia (in: enterobacteria) TaxID=2647522 RepID=UPI0037D0A861